jgi:hypothetical protein
MTEECTGCKRPEHTVALEPMPCCGEYVCWDFCLQEEPTKCPSCKEGIEVTLKDPVTKESYVTPTWVREVST